MHSRRSTEVRRKDFFLFVSVVNIATPFYELLFLSPSHQIDNGKTKACFQAPWLWNTARHAARQLLAGILLVLC